MWERKLTYRAERNPARSEMERSHAKRVAKGTCAAPAGAPRRLLHVPVVHSQEDMGSLAEQISNASISRVGREAWLDMVCTSKRFWEFLSDQVLSWDLDFSRTRVYQDALPVCGHELRIVQELVKAGSANHRLVLALVERGALLCGTESPRLLLEEYEMVRRACARAADGLPIEDSEGPRDMSASLLVRRDRYIASRINRTLLPGETGLLFLGILHAPARWLDRDIAVDYPIGVPKGRPGGENRQRGS